MNHNLCGFESRKNAVINFVKFILLGHDKRYSLDCTKIRKLGWKPEHDFEKAMKKTIKWFIENEWWWKPLSR